MNRTKAKRTASKITNAHIQQMFDNAKKSIKDWTKVSSVNKGMTKGTAWNMLTKGFDVNEPLHILAKINMLAEFGEFLPEEAKFPPLEAVEPKVIKPVHQDPIF